MSFGSVCLNIKAGRNVLINGNLNISGNIKLFRNGIMKLILGYGIPEVSGWKETSNLISTSLNSGNVFIIFALFYPKHVPKI